MALPSGFVLSKSLQQVKEYGVPESARKVLGPARIAALEVLDQILGNSLGLRLFEPKISLKETHVVKLQTNHQRSSPGSTRTESKTELSSMRRPGLSESGSQLDPLSTPGSSRKMLSKRQISLQSLKDKSSALRSQLQKSTVQSIL